jgi:hypothetical protein
VPRRTPGLLAFARVIDLLASPLTALAAFWLKGIRSMGLQYLPVSKRVLHFVGVLPVRDHYYEPLINPAVLKTPLSAPRPLPGIDLNVAQQLELLRRFDFASELAAFPQDPTGKLEFYYRNRSFVSGDAEFYYSLVRFIKPRRIVEVGCGQSTLIAQAAVKRNVADDAAYTCQHTCIEPYEQPWLERLPVTVMRSRVEDCDKSLFESLEHGDILFIDSSHVIRPQGDVVHEYLEVLPLLKSGVYVHVHDVFTPRDYLEEWVVEEIKLWNEQYLLEGFLTFNSEFAIVGALNYLKHNHAAEVSRCFPVLAREMETREPGSFWIVRR